MNTDILELTAIAESESLEQNDISVILEETEESIPVKRFGIVDLWNIRVQRRYFRFYGRRK